MMKIRPCYSDINRNMYVATAGTITLVGDGEASSFAASISFIPLSSEGGDSGDPN